MNIFRVSCAVILLCLSLPLSATEFIESFHSDIEVQRNGDLIVTETIVVKAEGQAIRRGIYRDFPTRYENARGRDVVVGFDLLSVHRDGQPEPYRITGYANGKRVYIGDNNVYLEPDFYQYRLSYRSTRQLGYFEEFDELYWNVTGTGWAFPIERASAQVSLPAAVAEFRLTGYTGPQGSTAQNLVYRQAGDNQAYFETSTALGRYEGLTIVAGWPKGIVEAPTTAQRRAWFFSDNRPVIIVAVGALALLVYYLLLWRAVGRDPEPGVIVPLYRAPEGYSPASMRFVQNMGYDKKCFTAAIVNLAVKGAVDIVEDDGNFKITRLGAANAPFAPGEAQVLAGLFADGGDNISIAQSNHHLLSNAIDRHRKSLRVDYEKKYFNTNRWLLGPGIVAALVLAGIAISTLGSEQAIFKTVFAGVFGAIPLIMLSAVARGFRLRGKRKLIQVVANVIALLIFGFAFFKIGFTRVDFIAEVPLLLVAGVLAMLVMNYLFYQWLKAPTLAGRRLLDKVEGFAHYLRVAEEDEIALQDAPTFGSDLYEQYLPYAIALDLENEWNARLDRAIAGGLVDQAYSQPRWYRSHSHGRGHFSKALTGSFNSAIAASSVAPGSSSGSSGGSSGGGGGGGGGGGW